MLNGQCSMFNVQWWFPCGAVDVLWRRLLCSQLGTQCGGHPVVSNQVQKDSSRYHKMCLRFRSIFSFNRFIVAGSNCTATEHPTNWPVVNQYIGSTGHRRHHLNPNRPQAQRSAVHYSSASAILPLQLPSRVTLLPLTRLPGCRLPVLGTRFFLCCCEDLRTVFHGRQSLVCALISSLWWYFSSCGLLLILLLLLLRLFILLLCVMCSVP